MVSKPAIKEASFSGKEKNTLDLDNQQGRAARRSFPSSIGFPGLQSGPSLPALRSCCT
jgi:hypothetical protein